MNSSANHLESDAASVARLKPTIRQTQGQQSVVKFEFPRQAMPRSVSICKRATMLAASASTTERTCPKTWPILAVSASEHVIGLVSGVAYAFQCSPM